MNNSPLQLPPAVVFEITYRCNHRCAFCYNPWLREPNAPREELSTGEAIAVLDTLRSLGVKQVTFSGGEPTTRLDLRDLIRHAFATGLKIGLITNGRLVDDGFLDFFALIGGTLSISVPGIKTFAQTTGVDNVTHVLSLFSKAKERGIRVNANVTVSRTNLPELYENLAYPLVYGAEYILLNRFMPGGRGMDNQNLLLDVEQLNQMLDVAETVLEKADRRGHIGTELPFCAIRDPQRYRFLSISSLCAAGKHFCCVDPGGYIKVCNHSPTRVCRYDELAEKLPTSSYWARFIASDYIPHACAGCKHLSRCHGGCREAAHVFTGLIDGIDPILPQ